MNKWKRVFSYGLILLLLSCAKRGFPPGGPKDLTPPEVLEVYPVSNSLKVNPSIEIILSFSERMDKESTEKSIFVTPVPEIQYDFKWNKNILILKPSQALEKSRTYVITVGTNAQDLHNNKMVESYSFAFSTGEKLDSGFISGRVFFKSNPDKGISIWSYSLSKDKEPDPKEDKPEYVTLSDEEGGYTLSYLGEGSYRLFAVKDLNNDLLWNPENEPLGITTKDVNLSSESLSFSHIDFTLVLRDTTPPALHDCQSLDKNKLRLEFDEPLSYKQGLYENDNYRIISDSLPKESLKVEQIYTKEEDYKKVYLITGEMSKTKYRIYVENLFDPAGNLISKVHNQCVFEGTELEDKAPLHIVFTHPQTEGVNVSLDTEIKLFFDKAAEKSSAEEGFLLEDSSGQKVEGKFAWDNPAILVYFPDEPLQGKMKYILSIKDLVDLWGNPLADTSFKITFYTLNPDTLGSLSGKVEVLGNWKGEIIIILEKIQAPKLSYIKSLKGPGDFKFESLFPGRYKLKTHLDLNTNGVLDLGKVCPFQSAEPQIFYPDTLNIRPRWETEVIIKFR